MSRAAESRPAAPAHSGVPVQPGSRPKEVVPLEWLDDPELAEQAARIDRLAADLDLITTLGLQGYQGDDWDVFEGELLLADAQTSGGLLIVGEVPGALVIGEVRPAGDVELVVR